MRTLCDHVFDLVQNSVTAGAERIDLVVEENVPENSVVIIITDDGRGIRPEHISKIKDTFFTTRSRKKRRCGLGLSMMDATCERAGGMLNIESEYRYGTTIKAVMEYDNIDRPPLGDLPDLFTSLLLSSMDNRIIWTLEHIFNGKSYRLKNRATKDDLNILSYGEPGVQKIVYGHIRKKEQNIHG